MIEPRSESVIIYASSDIKSLPITVISSPLSSPIYYVESNQLLNSSGNLISMDSSEKQTDSSESSNYNFYDVASTVQLSPVSDDCSENHHRNDRLTKLKRGRPNRETISTLIDSSDDNVSAIKCDICKRTFPREKSLQAHIRIHTGERPYFCDFPNCGRRFAQSGQLRTHQRLHTGEKPFVCNYEGCSNRFTHANRRCPEHPRAGVSRDKDGSSYILRSISSLSNANQEIVDWLNGYYKSMKRQGVKRAREGPSRPFKARKLDMDAYSGDSTDTGKETGEENIVPVWKKKRAAMELQAKKETNASKCGLNSQEDNESVPNEKLQTALALIELASSPVIDLNLKCQALKNEPFDSSDASFSEPSSSGDNYHLNYSSSQYFLETILKKEEP